MVLIEEGLWTYEKEGSFMKIILVTDEYGSLNNGTTMTAHRFYQMLRERGHDVHMLASGELTEPDYRARAGQYPIDLPGDGCAYECSLSPPAGKYHLYLPYAQGDSGKRHLHVFQA